jgi:hypothetical protein
MSSYAGAMLPRQHGHGATVLPTHADDGDVEVMLVVARCHHGVIVAMALSRRLGRDTMSMPSHAGDDSGESC